MKIGFMALIFFVCVGFFAPVARAGLDNDASLERLNALDRKISELRQRIDSIDLQIAILHLNARTVHKDITALEGKMVRPEPGSPRDPLADIRKDIAAIKDLEKGRTLRQWEVGGAMLFAKDTRYTGASFFHDQEGLQSRFGFSAYTCGSSRNVGGDTPFSESVTQTTDFKNTEVKEGLNKVVINGSVQNTMTATGTIQKTRRETCFAVAPEWRFLPDTLFPDTAHAIKLSNQEGNLQWRMYAGFGVLMQFKYQTMQTTLNNVVVNGTRIGMVKLPELPSRLLVDPQPFVSVGEHFLIFKFISVNGGIQLDIRNMSPAYHMSVGAEF